MANVFFDGKYQNLKNRSMIFELPFTVSKVLMLQMFDLEKVGQCYGI